jgi:predicted dehydrogenase
MKHTIAVVGCGYWGPNLIRNFLHLDNVESVYCLDTDPERMKIVQSRFKDVNGAENFDSLLVDDSIIVVAIATPVSTHFQLAKRALEAGKHVLVEKPLTGNSREAAKLVEIAEKSGSVLMVDHTYLFTGAVRKIRELVDKNTLGNLVYYDSTRINLGIFRDVNVLWDLATHDLSIIDNLFDSKMLSVSCTGNKLESYNHESIAFATINMDNGAVAHINVSWIAPVKIRLTLIGGTEKMLVYDDTLTSEKVKVYDKGVNILEDPEEIYRTRVQYRIGDMYAPKIENVEALHLECRYLLECIDNNMRPINDGVSGFRVVRVLEAATESMRKGGAQVPIVF